MFRRALIRALSTNVRVGNRIFDEKNNGKNRFDLFSALYSWERLKADLNVYYLKFYLIET